MVVAGWFILLFLSFLSFLLYPFLFSRIRICCTHFFSLVFSAHISLFWSTFSSRYSELNRRDHRCASCGESAMCVCVCVCVTLDFVFRHDIEITWLTLSVISLGGWLSFKPNFEAELSLDVPRPAFRTSFLIAHIHWSTTGQCASPLSTRVGCWLQIDAVFSPVFEYCPSEHASDEGSEEWTVQRPNGQVKAFVDPPSQRSFPTGPWLSAGSTCEPGLHTYNVRGT